MTPPAAWRTGTDVTKEEKMSDGNTANDTGSLLAALQTFEHGKVVSAREAVQLVRDGNTLGTCASIKGKGVIR